MRTQETSAALWLFILSFSAASICISQSCPAGAEHNSWCGWELKLLPTCLLHSAGLLSEGLGAFRWNYCAGVRFDLQPRGKQDTAGFFKTTSNRNFNFSKCESRLWRRSTPGEVRLRLVSSNETWDKNTRLNCNEQKQSFKKLKGTNDFWFLSNLLLLLGFNLIYRSLFEHRIRQCVLRSSLHTHCREAKVRKQR